MTAIPVTVTGLPATCKHCGHKPEGWPLSAHALQVILVCPECHSRIGHLVAVPPQPGETASPVIFGINWYDTIPAEPSYRDAYDTALTAWRKDHAGDMEETEIEDECESCAAYLKARDAFITALHEENERDAAEDYYPVGREAICTVCGQSFTPADEDDLIHLVTTVPPGEKWGPDYTGDLPEGPERYCGGRGEMTGSWG